MGDGNNLVVSSKLISAADVVCKNKALHFHKCDQNGHHYFVKAVVLLTLILMFS